LPTSGGNRFNLNKLLIDPYAREISHDPLNPDASVFASGSENRVKEAAPSLRKAWYCREVAPAPPGPESPPKNDIII